MKMIFLGLLFCEESLKDALKYSKVGVQYAPHKYQDNLLKGLKDYPDLDLRVINVPPTGSFPIHNKQLFSKEYVWEMGKQIGFLNLPKLKHFVQAKKIYKECKKIIEKTDEIVNVVFYSPYKPFVQVCTKLKKKYSNVKLTLIQTDPIQGRGDLERFMTDKAMKKGDKLVERLKIVDSFVVLTSYLAQTLETNERPYTIIECVSDSSQSQSTEVIGTNNIVLYTGTLEKEYGILDIAKAFAKMPDYQLCIYGNGEAEEDLRELSNKNENIKFFGFADAKTIDDARDKCSYLINPRRPTGTFTKYSFPSKTAEYMLSGKPVIMYKLEGVPDEYDNYLNYLSTVDFDGVQNELENILSTNYNKLKEKAVSAREFMLVEKGPLKQAEKLVNLLRENNK